VEKPTTSNMPASSGSAMVKPFELMPTIISFGRSAGLGRIGMTLFAHVGKDLPEQYFVGIDFGYREPVACVIDLRSFVQGGEGQKRTICLAFPSNQAGIRRLLAYLYPTWLIITAKYGCSVTLSAIDYLYLTSKRR